MITRELKLKPNKKQVKQLEEWLWILTGVYNWALRKIELDAQDKIYYGNYPLTTSNKLRKGLDYEFSNKKI